MLLCRKESRDRQTGWRVHCYCEEPGLRAESGTPAEDPKCLQQVQRVQWWQSPARNADVWNGQSKSIGIKFTCYICLFYHSYWSFIQSACWGRDFIVSHSWYLICFLIVKETTHTIQHEIFLLQVDKHIRRLDADLARFENELKEKLELSGYESAEARGVKSESSY